MSNKIWINKSLRQVNVDNAMIQIYSEEFPRPFKISLRDIANSINQQLFKDNESAQWNFSKGEFENVIKKPSKPKKPTPDATVQKTFMATDDNYLYVWLPKLDKWKRIPMTEF